MTTRRHLGPLAIRAYECVIVGTEWHRVINARTAGQAKGMYLRRVRDAWPGAVKFTDIRVRSLGAPQSSEDFLRCAAGRGLPEARCGMRVVAHGRSGFIVGHNASANFDVLFDGDPFPLNVHPHGLTLVLA